MKWGDACLLSAVFSLEEKGDKAVGVVSIERLILNTVVKDEEYRYAMSVKDKLAE